MLNSKILMALGSLLAISIAQAAIPTNALPSSVVLPTTGSKIRGFIVRTAQAPTDTLVANNSVRALRQINGNLTDAAGVRVINEAIPGEQISPTAAWSVETINFELGDSGSPVPVDVTDIEGNVVRTFDTAALFPGIPGAGGHFANFAVEAVGFLKLPAGITVFGVSVSSDRTDVNDDDGYAVFVGANPRDFFGTKVGEYDRNAFKPFASNQRNENTWVVNAPTAGLYPVRLLYWQTGHGANLQFYTVNEGGERILVNDPNDERAIQSFIDSTSPIPFAAYVAEATPGPGSDGVAAAAPITVTIADAKSTVQTAEVGLFLNGTKVVSQSLSKTNGLISLVYAPNATRTTRDNLVRLEYADSVAANRTNSWNFGIVTSGGSSTTVTGQWDFEQGDLRASVGQALAYFDSTFDGPTGSTADKTSFGTVSSYGLTALPGGDAKVLRVPGTLDRKIGYVMTHGISPNGGGTRVNQYTLIMDVYVASSGPGAASLWQTSSLANSDDGDLFWQGSNFGQGGGGYNGRGTFTAGAWHRVVAAYDMAVNPPVVVKYVDGVKQDDWTANQGLDSARRTLQATAILFGDGDQDERREMFVNSIQIRSGKLSDAECFSLGSPTAAGIPKTLPQSSVTGQWDFEFGDLSASIGTSLAYFDPAFDGPAGSTDNKTSFGLASTYEIPALPGGDATVLRVPGTLDRRLGYVMNHRISPNGGGSRVNQYTLIMDVFVATSGPGAASLWQTSSLANSDDGDLFWQGNNFGQGGGGYNGRGTFTAGAWHRVAAAYDMAANPPVVVKYVDGIKQDDWTANQGLDSARRALQVTAILFGDGDQDERREMFVSSVQIRSERLSDAQMFLLGGPTAAGIPVSLPTSTVTGQWDFESGDLTASIGANLAYFDPAFDGPAGSTDNKTSFGLASTYGISALADGDATVLRVPGTLDRRLGYVMNHRISPNGGGSRVNQYTLIMDVFVATSGPGAASLWQTSSLANSDDGDLFWQGNNFGQGGGGYNGRSTFTAGAWHRVAAAYDMAANPPVVVKYVDGIKQDDWTANQGLDSARRTLQATAILFGDGDQDERREMFVSSVQIRSERLSDAQMFLLGGPTAAGIPVSLPTSTVTGQWDFGFGDLGASIGASLAYLDPAFDGSSGAAADKTAFGTVSSFGLPALAKGDPTVMRVPGTLDRKLGYVMAHRIAPNGGGSRVNQFTLVLDMFIAASGPGAASLLQTSSLGNTDDGDLFWQGNNFGQGGNGYNGTGIFTPGAWHRVVAAYDMAATPPVVTKFIDGIKQDDWTANQSLDNPRRALQATALLFADGDQDERREMWIRGVQIRSGKLSDAEMVMLGSADGGAIPVLITDPSISPEKPVTAGNPPAALGGVALTGVVDRTAKTIIADLPSNGAQGYLSIHPKVTVTSVSIVNGKLVIRYQ